MTARAHPGVDAYIEIDAPSGPTAARSRTGRIAEALAEGGLGLVAHVDDGNGNHPRLRRLLFDLIEEYSRHTGHADLLREALDGRVGEDPPEDWSPAWL